ncbi:MAG: class I SAM-dependent methyltransferase [Terrimicrobiaceae bacterium]|jgi:SAM-dependent methyltransferase
MATPETPAPLVTREKQYQFMLDQDQYGLSRFGLMSGQVWRDDPRRLTFLLSRYKFVAKMLNGKQSALEVGCADAFGTRLVRQEVPQVTATDFDPLFIENAKAVADPKWPLDFAVHDMMEGPYPGAFDAAYALDVIEHIQPNDELVFTSHIVRSLAPHGILIFGCPSIHSQAYASPPSKEGHVNCKDEPGLRSLVGHFFHNVFLFSMNDEVVHTGFHPMAHYLLAIGTDQKATPSK